MPIYPTYSYHAKYLLIKDYCIASFLILQVQVEFWYGLFAHHQHQVLEHISQKGVNNISFTLITIINLIYFTKLFTENSCRVNVIPVAIRMRHPSTLAHPIPEQCSRR